MISANREEWCTILRLLAVVDIHPMMTYHYSKYLKKLPRPTKLRIRNVVNEYVDSHDFTGGKLYYQRLYPILLILFGKNRHEYTGIIDDFAGLESESARRHDSQPSNLSAYLKHIESICHNIGVSIQVPKDNRIIDAIRMEYLQIIQSLQDPVLSDTDQSYPEQTTASL